MAEREFVDTLKRRYSAAKEDRAIWNSHWEDVARLVLPDFVASFTGGNTPGTERGQTLYDNTAGTALFRFAAAMESMLTPRNGKWHRIKITDDSLMSKRNVQLWCDQVNKALFSYRYAQTANFQSQQHDGYVSVGAFGTSCMFTDRLRSTDPRERGLRYRNVNLGSIYLAENHQGIADTVWRCEAMTFRQIGQRWGKDALTDKMKAAFDKNPEDTANVLHGVCPREDFDYGRIDSKGFRFASYYLLEDGEDLLEEGGFKTFPYATARYRTAPGEIYGRSPAMMVLPTIKGLNEQKKTVLKTAHRAVDPVLLAHDDGVLNGLTLRPGAVNYGAVSADGRPLVHALPTGDIRTAKEHMDDDRVAINDTFLVSLFQILTEQPQMTATEVLERAREKGALLSPTMGRFQSEALGPLIEREYSILLEEGLLPPIPPELIEAGAKWMPEFDAPLNRAMRAEEGAGLQRTVQFAMEIANATQNPEVLDAFDFDRAIPDLADINGTPYAWMADPAAVAAKRKARQNQVAQQQLVDAAPALASTLKAVSPQGTQAA